MTQSPFSSNFPSPPAHSSGLGWSTFNILAFLGGFSFFLLLIFLRDYFDSPLLSIFWLFLGGIFFGVGFVLFLNPVQKTSIPFETKEKTPDSVSLMTFSQMDSASFDELFRISPEMLCIASFEGYFQRLNPSFEKVLGWTQEELMGKPFLEFVVPEDREKTRQEMQQIIDGNPTLYFENSYLCKNGEVRILAWSAISNPLIKMVYAFARDITAKKKAEEALRLSEQRFRILVETSPDVILLLQQEGKISFVNSTFPVCHPQEVLGTNIFRYFSEEQSTLYQKSLQDIFKSKESKAFEIQLQNKTEWFVRLVPLIQKEQVESVMVVATEVTEQKKAEHALQESEERYRSLVEFCPDAILIHHQERFIYANTAAMALLRASQIHQIIGTHVSEIVHDDYKEDVKERIQYLYEKRARINLVEEKFICFDGQIVEVEVSAQCINYDEKIAIMAICKDITKRKIIEEKQKQNEALNRSIIEAIPGGIVQVNERGFILAANQQAQEILGISYDELTSRYIADFGRETIWEDGSPCPFEEYPAYKCLQTGLTQGPTTIGIKRPDGKISWAVFRAIPLKNNGDEKKSGAIVTFMDITDRKQLEEEYRQAQKMEAIGQLAGGLAHDFNNLLSAVIGYSELALIELSSKDLYYEEFQKIHEAGKRAEGLTRQLLAFSRKQVLQIKIINLSEGIAEFSNILSRLIGEQIVLETKLDPVLGQIKADFSQIQQILMNLAVNARDAMPKGGKISITTTNVSFREQAPSPEIPLGEYVLLTFRDTGHGIDADTLPYIFDPFFTTKKVGQGTGLGLSTVYGIVKQHNGYISVWSEPQQGTCFNIYFPLVHQGASTPTTNKIFQLKDKSGHERILVVEDEPIVRQLVKSILTSKGYKVFDAENAQKALEMIRSNPVPIELLFTDVIMPGMNGKELYEQLKQTLPHLKVIYTSGYSQEVIDHNGVLEEDIQLLQKPFIVEQLLWKVRETLDSEIVS